MVAVAEEILPSQDLFTSFVLEQDNDTAATSCFMLTPASNFVMDFHNKFDRKLDEFNC